MGATRQLTAGVWMGNDDNAPSDGVFGGLYPAMLWKSFMGRALAGVPAKPLPQPPIPKQEGGNAIERLLSSAKRALGEGDGGAGGGDGDGGVLREAGN
jgi:penicillin-binding protein 1A